MVLACTITGTRARALPLKPGNTLVCFSNGEKHGYFSKHTGRLVIEPKYDHAWTFSDGLACVDEGGRIKFINAAGEVVIDNGTIYKPDMDGCVFHEGYCVVYSEDGEQCGLMDKTGKIVLPMDYSSIDLDTNAKLWQVQKDGKKAVFNKRMEPVLPLMECCIYIDNGTIDVTMPDHTIRKYDYAGNLIHDFYVCGVRTLEYEKDEIKYEYTEIGDIESTEMKWEPCHPRATARLRAYTAGDGYEGLMTADGHIVTMPLYTDIDAIGYDLYLCTTTNYDKIIVNGKGEIVK